MDSKKILIIVLATAVFAMCLYMFGLENSAAQSAGSAAFSVGDFLDWARSLI